jgi:ADP-ribose pyrophosphatase YjhB (NUDIX family)
VELLPFDEYVARLPRRPMSAAVLVRAADGRVLLVEPSYKPGWEPPGGVVEDGESPWEAAEREVTEEIGLEGRAGRLLVVDHIPATADGLPERLAFIFDGGLIDPGEVPHLVLGQELRSAALCDDETLATRAKSLLHNRVLAAIRAANTGVTTMCENGRPI